MRASILACLFSREAFGYGVLSWSLNKHIIKINYGADIEEFQCVICAKISTEKFHMRMHVENWHFPTLLE